ncbi:unnamed protein product [Enterobius vermicularis]|uniref:Membrane-associated kinase regulator 6 n=1 Tax=Enterobius vermicularis TaxID=51028 RepID=A0A0N4UY22_ENTVE|nr:unnamed protein product [Enterobius vermicularis]
MDLLSALLNEQFFVLLRRFYDTVYRSVVVRLFDIGATVMEVDSHEFSPSRCTVNWPSKSSVLETPERKRFQHSISFSDSGLGSSLLRTPPDQESMKPLKTSPLLRTPTDRSGRSVDSFCCNATPSPIKSFVHMSSYSSTFSSPEIRKCSLSRHELRLSNPENATSYKFSGDTFIKNRGSPINMTSSDIITQNRPFSVRQNHMTAPSTSRASNRALVLPSPSNDAGIENDEKAADVTIPYAILETPSKGLGFDPIDKNFFGVDDFMGVATSTPLRDINEGHVDMMAFPVNYPRLYEQTSGPLEGSICESLEAPGPVSGLFTSPSKITLSNAYPNGPRFVDRSLSEPSYNEVVPDRPRPAFFTRGRENFIDNSYSVAESASLTNVNVTEPRPFRVPTKSLKPFSRSWSKIVFGETREQRELTRRAHTFMETHSLRTFL